MTAIDADDLAALDRLLPAQLALVRDRLHSPGAWLCDHGGTL